MRFFVCVLFVLASAVPSEVADAQASDTHRTASGVLGAGRTWDDESSLGTGPVIGGRVDWRVFGTTRVELSVDALLHDRKGGFFQADGRTAFIGASLLHRFGAERVQPYILGGLHLARHSGSTTFADLRVERDSTDFGYHFGGGLVVRAGERLEVGPEARFYMIQPGNDSDPALAYWIGARVGVRF
jgi:opacity protein-like surface antigen